MTSARSATSACGTSVQETGSFLNTGVNRVLQRTDLLFSEGFGVEVEAETLGRNAGALLSGVRRDDFVQCPVEQMGRRMVCLDGVSASG